MKILYLAEWDAFSNSGVLRKIKAQFETWLKMGIDARLLIVSPKSEVGAVIEGEGVSVVSHSVGRFGLGKVFKAFALLKAKKLVREFSPDVIYYRQSSWTPGVIGLLRTARCVVAEVNSNDVFEIRQAGGVKAHYHLLTRKWVIRKVNGFVCVGRELGEFYAQYGKPVAVVGNGFDTSSVTPNRRLSNDRPQMIFVGSAGQVWHGVDKLVEVAGDLSDMDFHIVGESVERVPSNFKTYGFLNWAELSSLYERMDFGFGTLALHRKMMNEISPLKTREYLAYGIPVIGAYEDTDLGGCDFFLRIPNSESGVRDSIGLIREFVSKWKGRSVDMDCVKQRIDSSVKEKQRVGFMKSVLDGLS